MTDAPPPHATPAPAPHPAPVSRRRAWLRVLIRLAVIVALVAAGMWLVGWMQSHIADLEAAAQRRMMTAIVIAGILAYALIIAIPFVPGIEIAIALMVMAGPIVAPFVWLATVLGLMLAHLTGRWVPLVWLADTLADLGLSRAAAMIRGIAATPVQSRLSLMSDRLPAWLAPLATRYRYGLVALLLNLPGNIALGGGGGIMLATGLSRLFTPARMMLTVALATAPVPLLVWVFGTGVLS